MTLTLRDRLAFALDVPITKASELLLTLGHNVGWVKVNRAFLAGGVTLMNAIVNNGAKSFLDLKWHDIPETVRGYVEEATTSMKLGMFNVHALGGYDMMAACREYLDNAFKDNPADKPLLIAVTILTSLDDNDLREVGIEGLGTSDLSVNLAIQAIRAGCDGLVAAAPDVKMIRSEIGDEPIIVTPAIRFADVAVENDDQKRMATPEVAVANGSDILVMGRPLIQGGLTAVSRAYEEIMKGLKARALGK